MASMLIQRGNHGRKSYSRSANNALRISADLFRGVASTRHISLSAKHFPMVYGTDVALTKMYKHSLVYYEKMSLKVQV